MTTVSLEEFHQNVEATEEAAQQGAVIVRGKEKPQYVVLTYDHYARLISEGPTLAEAFSMPLEAGDAIDFEIPKLGSFGFKPANFS